MLLFRVRRKARRDATLALLVAAAGHRHDVKLTSHGAREQWLLFQPAPATPSRQRTALDTALLPAAVIIQTAESQRDTAPSGALAS